MSHVDRYWIQTALFVPRCNCNPKQSSNVVGRDSRVAGQLELTRLTSSRRRWNVPGRSDVLDFSLEDVSSVHSSSK